MENLGTFNIATPCHANWDSMTPETQGRFCAACQKCVVDFTNKSKQEIVDVIANTEGEVCGRVLSSQLVGPRKPVRAKVQVRTRGLKFVQLFALALFAAFVFLFTPVQAQTQRHEVMGKMAYVPQTANVAGKVSWDSGKSAAGVVVELRMNGQLIASTTTTANGHYKISNQRTGIYTLVAIGPRSEGESKDVKLSSGGTVTADLTLYDIRVMGEMIYVPDEPKEIIEQPQPIVPIIEKVNPILPIITPTEPESHIEKVQVSVTEIPAPVDPGTAIPLKDFQIKVFPNPTTDQVTLQISKMGTGNFDVFLYDIEGQVVYKGEWVQFMEPYKRIEMANLPAGIYVLHMAAGTQSVQRRLIKI